MTVVWDEVVQVGKMCSRGMFFLGRALSVLEGTRM